MASKGDKGKEPISKKKHRDECIGDKLGAQKKALLKILKRLRQKNDKP